MKLFIFVTLFSIFFSSFALAVVWYPLPKEAHDFGRKYPEAQSLLYAFDYGHALVYERLLINRGMIVDQEKFEKDLLKEVIKILKNPPTVKMEETDIAPYYVFMFPLTVDLFDWSHMLHQFVFDVMVSDLDRQTEMKDRINEIFKQYKANKAVAITDKCKSMLFMDGHYFSKSFRRNYPSFNLLIWSYHWFQVRLYEDLMAATEEKRDANIKKTIKDFWQLISDLPDSAEFDMMPDVFLVAPTFTKLSPEIAAAFNNNHMLHDVVTDILVSDKVEYNKIKTEGIRFGRMGLDPKAFSSETCKL